MTRLKQIKLNMRDAAKVSTLSSTELHRYEYLTSKYLGYKPGVVEQGKFEYSPLRKVFNKRLEKEDKKEGLLKRLKNIEDTTKDQIKVQLKSIEKKCR